MGRLWVIIVREYTERVRTRWFALATVFAPLLLAALMFVPPWLASRSTASVNVSQITILDASGSGLGKRIAAELNGGIAGDTSATRVLEVAPAGLAAAEAAATRDVMRGGAKGYLVLDALTLAGERARYAGTNASASADVEELRRAVRQEVMAVRLERAGVDPLQTSALIKTRLRLDAERITSRGRAGSGEISIFFAITVSLLLYFSIFFYGQNVLRGVMEEKQTRVAEVVMSSVPASRLLDGKVLGVGAVGLTQLLLWAVAAFFLLKIRQPILERIGVEATPITLPDLSIAQGITLLIFFVLGFVFYAALFAAVGAIVNSEQEAQQAQIPIVLLLAGSVSFIQAIIARPDAPLAVTLSWLPFSAPIVMPLRMSLIQIPTWEIAGAIASLAVGCYIVVWVAARIYRVGLLMYGKRPTIREIARWVRYS